MNPYIPKLLRARYAMNMIVFITHGLEGAWDKCTRTIDDLVAELDLPLFEERDGKRVALHGDYVAQIFKDVKERTGITIEELNLRKRIMGIHGTIETYTPAHIYRDAILKYLGIESWNTLETDAELLYHRLYLDVCNNIHNSLFGVTTISYAIKPHTLNKGDEVLLIMSQGTHVILSCLGDCQFKVKNVKGLSIHKDDILHITPPFIRKNRLYADTFICYGKDKGEYLSEHTIIDYKLTKGEISKLKDRDKAMAIIAEAERKRKEREENARG